MRKIIEDGFLVGGHTKNHCILDNIKDRRQVEYEIKEDKKILEKITKRKVKYFAYPSGKYYNPEIQLQNILKDAGYSGAVTTVPGFNYLTSNNYLLKRDLTDAPMHKWAFRARVYGNYDAVLCFKHLIYGVKQNNIKNRYLRF